MRAIVCKSLGPLDDLVIEERPSASLAPGEVRVRVTAAGVNFVDALLVQGRYQIKPPTPFVPGGESVGVVTELGEGVTRVESGERVLVTSGLGGFATEIVAPTDRLFTLPATLTDGQAATFMQSYMTAYFALMKRAHMERGQWLLVLGAGGGVGLAAVDVGRGARAPGHRSGVVGRQARDGSQPRRGRRDRFVDGRREKREREISGGGVDAVYDAVGGRLGEECLRSFREDGQFIVIGFASGDIPKLPANQVLLRNRRVTGVDWGGWVARNPAANQEMIGEVLTMIDAGELDPVEPSAYPFDQVARALSDQQNRKVVGKAVLVP